MLPTLHGQHRGLTEYPKFRYEKLTDASDLKTLGGAQLSSQTAENTYETDEKPVISEKLIILGIQRTTKP